MRGTAQRPAVVRSGPLETVIGIQSALMSATGQSPGERLFLIKIVMAETGAPARLVHGRPGERA